MSHRRLAEALLQGRPYFGPCLGSAQGPPDRHRYFQPLVKALARKGPLDILEIGSWAGASAISWASALKRLGLDGRVMCVDPWLPYFDPQREAPGRYEQMNRAARSGLIYPLFQHNVSAAGFEKTVLPKVGKSCEVLPKLEAQTFDIVYVDGSHLLEDVLFDLHEAKRLIRPGGIVCGDDLELQLQELDRAEVERAAGTRQDYVAAGGNGCFYHPGVTLAVARELGSVSAWEGFWAVRRSGEQWSPVTLEREQSRLPRHIRASVIRKVGEVPGYHLISSQRRYYGLSQDLGDLDAAAELLQEDDLPPVLFTGSTLDELRQKIGRSLEIQAAETQKRVALYLYPTPVLVGSHRGFNLVRFRTTCYGVRQALGHVDLSMGADAVFARFGRRDAVTGESLEGVKARIDAIEAERSLEELVVRLQALVEQNQIRTENAAATDKAGS